MCVVEARAYLHDNANSEPNRNSFFELVKLAKDEAQVEAMKILHDHKISALVFSHLKSADDVWVAQVCRSARFIEEHAHIFRLLNELWKNALNDDEFFKSIKAKLLRQKNLCHTAGSDAFEQEIL